MRLPAFALLATLASTAGSQQDTADWYTGQHRDLFLSEPEREATGIDWQVQDAFATWSTELPQAYGRRGVWVSPDMQNRIDCAKLSGTQCQ